MRGRRPEHFNIPPPHLAATVNFYENILGLENGPRPDFPFPGAWLYSEGRPVVHLVDISPTGEPQKPDSGVVHHVAFVSRDFDAMKQRLAAKGVTFEVKIVPSGDIWQIFVRDPNGVMIELNYDAANEQVRA